MLLDRKFCGTQILRFSVLCGFPKERAAHAELAKALADSCHSNTHAEAVVDQIISSSEFSPTPFTVRSVAADLAGQFRSGGQPAGCEECSKTGFRPYKALVTRDSQNSRKIERLTEEEAAELEAKLLAANVNWMKQAVYGFVEPCPNCALGRRFAQYQSQHREAA